MIELPVMPDTQKWSEMPFVSQMANIGSEVGRTLKWKKKGNDTQAQKAFIRALDLFDLTVRVGRTNDTDASSVRGPMLKELLRARDSFCAEYFSTDPEALSSSEKYFSHFAKAYSLRKTGILLP